MKEQFKTNDLSSLGGLKEELQNNEPIDENIRITPAMLKSPVSKKLFKYFFATYPDVITKYIKKEPGKTEFFEEMKNILSSEKSLEDQKSYCLKDLFIKFIKKVPVSQTANNGVVFGKLARDAGCIGPEVEDAKKMLNLFIEPTLKKIFNN